MARKIDLEKTGERGSDIDTRTHTGGGQGQGGGDELFIVQVSHPKNLGSPGPWLQDGPAGAP